MQPIELLVSDLDTEKIDRYLFRSPPLETELINVFGGQVLAQSLSSAYKTIEGDRKIHSMHAYFLRPGNISAPILYEVDPIRDGGSFTTRRVVAIQNGKAIFNTAISFKTDEDGLEHQDPMPEVPAPETLPSDDSIIEQKAAVDPEFDRPIRSDILGAFETRTNGDLPMQVAVGDSPVHGFWFKASSPIESTESMHHVLLAFVSDMRLMMTALRPHGINYSNPNLIAASLDHALWIHRNVDVNDWIYYDLTGPTATGGRGLNFGRFYDREGQLIASSAQEGLIRMRDNMQKN